MKPVYQRWVVWTSYFLGGFLAIGAVLDSISSAISVVSIPVAYTGSIAILVLWAAIEVLLRKQPLRWIAKDGQNILVNRLGTRPRVAVIGAVTVLWIPQLFGVVDLKQGAGTGSQEMWLRITDTWDLSFSRSEHHVGPSGEIKGIVSNPSSYVLLLYRLVKRCQVGESTPAPAKGASAPSCREDFAAVEISWSASEAIVDAAGNWTAQVCDLPRSSPARPTLEYWEFRAVATPIKPTFLLDLQSPGRTCNVDPASLSAVQRLACSDTLLIPSPDGFWGMYWPTFAPQPTTGCFR